MIIDLKQLEQNYFRILQIIDGVPLGIVLKSNAYGLGLEKISQKLWDLGVKDFFVRDIQEAIFTRNLLPDAKICVLNGYQDQYLTIYEDYRIYPIVIHDIIHENIPKSLPIWLHFNTGLNREGINNFEEKKDYYLSMNVHGVMSHLYRLDNILDNKIQSQFEKSKYIFSHFSCMKSLLSSSSIEFPKEYHYDLIRVGKELYFSYQKPNSEIVQVFSFIVSISNIKKGESIGYNGRFIADKNMRIALVDIGFAQGLHPNHPYMKIHNYICKVIGAVSMDYAILDITDYENIEIGDQVNVYPYGLIQTSNDIGCRASHFSTGMSNRLTYKYNF